MGERLDGTVALAIGAVARTVDELGRLDTLINNAGVMLLGPVDGAPTEEWGRMIDLNLKDLLYTVEAGDIADAIAYIVTRPRRMAVNEVLIRPTNQVG